MSSVLPMRVTKGMMRSSHIAPGSGYQFKVFPREGSLISEDRVALDFTGIYIGSNKVFWPDMCKATTERQGTICGIYMEMW